MHKTSSNFILQDGALEGFAIFRWNAFINDGEATTPLIVPLKAWWLLSQYFNLNSALLHRIFFSTYQLPHTIHQQQLQTSCNHPVLNRIYPQEPYPAGSVMEETFQPGRTSPGSPKLVVECERPSTKYARITPPNKTTLQMACTPPSPTLPRRKTPKTWKCTTTGRFPLRSSITGDAALLRGSNADCLRVKVVNGHSTQFVEMPLMTMQPSAPMLQSWLMPVMSASGIPCTTRDCELHRLRCINDNQNICKELDLSVEQCHVL